MTELTKKEALLEGSGYRYHFDRMVYYNRDTRRALSLEFVEDHSVNEIHGIVRENPTQNGWTFYFNESPSDGVKRELSERLPFRVRLESRIERIQLNRARGHIGSGLKTVGHHTAANLR